MKMRVYIGVLSMALGGTLAPVAALAGFDFVPPAAVPAPEPVLAPADNTLDPVISSAPEDQAEAPPSPSSTGLAVAPRVPPPSAPPVTPMGLKAHAPASQVIERITDPVPAASPPMTTAPVTQRSTPNTEGEPTTSSEAKTAAYPAPYQAPQMTAPVTPAPAVVAPVTKQSMLDAPRPIDTPPLAIVAGFGNQIPLSFAMQQIVPPDFSVEYQDQPDPDTIVSWAGGRAWNKVLEDMLYAHGYRVRVVGKTVSIFKAKP